ncbi:hypothetical protein [Ascidiimonas sp. W6]|uniref:hypothetical protein n=1 Tax=Ascidiimonas meishanensis TaxID=3128903 RepID=UPI0030EDEF68
MKDKLNFHTKSDHIKSELFRFVNVRQASTPTNTIGQHHIFYDQYVTKEVSSNLYSKLQDLERLNAKEAKASLTHILKEFGTSKTVIDSPHILEKLCTGFSQFYSWSINVKTEKSTYITNKLENLTGQAIADIAANTNLHSQVWDNYFYHILQGVNAEMVQRLTEVIRVFSIAKELLKTDKESINGLERASIILPKSIVILLSIDNLETLDTLGEEQNGTPIQNFNTKNTHSLMHLEQAKEELEQSLPLEAAIISKNEEYTSDTTKNKISENKQDWQRVNEITKTLLKEKGFIKEKNSVTEAIAYLDEEIRKTYEKSFSKVKAYKTIKLVGSAIVEIENKPKLENTPEKPTIELKKGKEPTAQESILSMYNSWWKNQDASQLLEIQIGDFKRVEQETKCYVPGEVAHIENVLQGEKKTRETRRFTRSETSSYYQSETTEENERDVQTTDRFEMEKETENIITSDLGFEAGMNVSANYGVVQIGANAGFSYNTSSENSNRQATEYAKSVTERARNKMVKKVKETRTATLIREFEDKNTHEINNDDNPSGNVVGVYRWVDKIYKASLVNYGRRMMVKFNLIEPSAYYQWTQINNPGEEIKFPLSPSEVAAQYDDDTLYKLNSFLDINENNYDLWAAQYGADVKIPPKKYISQGKSYSENVKPEMTTLFVEKNDFRIPEGYNPSFINVLADHNNTLFNNPNIEVEFAIIVGATKFVYKNIDDLVLINKYYLLSNSLETVPIYFSANIKLPNDNRLILNTELSFGANIIIHFKRTEEAYNNWKKETYNAIMAAYQNKLNEATYAKSQLEATAGIQIKGKNPSTNRKNIETELKKGCIESLRVYAMPWLQHYLSQQKFKLHNGIISYANPWPIVSNPDDPYYDSKNGPMVYRPLAQASVGKYISFMEECFEWENMTYKFHPYFWANHSKWKTLINLEDNDPLFEHFLKAGSSNIVVPVRPGFEKLFAYYLNTGKMWYGEEVPLTENLHNFLENINTDPNATPETEACWNIKLPTKLVILQQQDGGLNATGLPCFKLNCDCAQGECSCDEPCE